MGESKSRVTELDDDIMELDLSGFEDFITKTNEEYTQLTSKITELGKYTGGESSLLLSDYSETSESIQEIQIDTNDFLNFIADGFVKGYDNTTKNEEESIKSEMAELMVMGYEQAEYLAPVELELLSERCAYVQTNVNPTRMFSDIFTRLTEVKTTLAGSEATLVDKDSKNSRAFAQEIDAISVPTGVDKNFQNVLVKAIQSNNKTLSPGESAENIYRVLINGSDSNYYNFLTKEQDTAIAYIKSFNFIYNKYVEKSQSDGVKDRVYRNKTSIYLLRYQIENLYEMMELQKEKMLFFLNKIYKKEDKYYYKCEHCGEMVDLTGFHPVSFYIFPTEGKPVAEMSRNLFKCQCGAGSLLTDIEYDLIEKEYSSKYKLKSPIYGDYIKEFSSGTSFCVNSPAPYKIYDLISYLVIKDEIETDERIIDFESFDLDENLDNTEEADTSSVNLDDYLKSINIFHNSLKYINDLEDGKLDYKKVAMSVCKLLSINYNITKNNAMISLANELLSNNTINKYLTMERIWMLEVSKNYLDNNLDTSLGLVSGELANNLFDIYQIIQPSFDLMEQFEVIDLNNKELIKVLVEFLKANSNLITEEIGNLKGMRDKIVNSLDRYKELYAYTSITFSKSISLKYVQPLLCDEKIRDVFDEITDRMIITNHSYDFFQVWGVTGPERLISGAKQLKNKQGIDVTDKIGATISDIYKEDNFKISSLTELTPVNVKHCFRLERYLKTRESYRYLDIYEFNKSLKNFKLDDFNCYGYKLSDKIKEDLNKVMEYVKNVKDASDNDYTDYYLGDMFSKDEIDYEYLAASRLKINRYVLKRLDGESFLDYLDRYEITKKKSDFNRKNSIFTEDKFKDIVEHSILLNGLTLLYQQSYQNYTDSLFMVCLVNVGIHQGGLTKGLKTLGISDLIYKQVVEEMENWMSNCEDSKAYYKILYNLYPLKIQYAIDTTRLRYESTTLINNRSFADSNKFFGVLEEVSEDLTNALDESEFSESELVSLLDRFREYFKKG